METGRKIWKPERTFRNMLTRFANSKEPKKNLEGAGWTYSEPAETFLEVQKIDQVFECGAETFRIAQFQAACRKGQVRTTPCKYSWTPRTPGENGKATKNEIIVEGLIWNVHPTEGREAVVFPIEVPGLLFWLSAEKSKHSSRKFEFTLTLTGGQENDCELIIYPDSITPEASIQAVLAFNERLSTLSRFRKKGGGELYRVPLDFLHVLVGTVKGNHPRNPEALRLPPLPKDGKGTAQKYMIFHNLSAPQFGVISFLMQVLRQEITENRSRNGIDMDLIEKIKDYQFRCPVSHFRDCLCASKDSVSNTTMKFAFMNLSSNALFFYHPKNKGGPGRISWVSLIGAGELTTWDEKNDEIRFTIGYDFLKFLAHLPGAGTMFPTWSLKGSTDMLYRTEGNIARRMWQMQLFIQTNYLLRPISKKGNKVIDSTLYQGMYGLYPTLYKHWVMLSRIERFRFREDYWEAVSLLKKRQSDWGVRIEVFKGAGSRGTSVMMGVWPEKNRWNIIPGTADLSPVDEMFLKSEKPTKPRKK